MTDLVGRVIFNATVTRLWWELDDLEVYEAVSNYHGQRSALEVHRPVAGSLLEGAQRSSRVGALIGDSSAVLAPIDVGFLDDGRYYIMRAVPRTGRRLVELLSGPMLVPRALAIALSLTRVAEVVHARGFTIGKLRCETIFIEERPDGEHVRLFDFRYAVTEYVSDDHRQNDIRQCATILYELASGTRVPNSSIYELRRVPKAIQALLEQAFDGEFESASAFANAIAIHPAAAPTLPSARLIK